MKKLLSVILIGLIVCSSLLLTNCLVEGKTKSKTWVVSQDGTGNFVSIQSAIDYASAGDIIRVKAGVYYEHLVISKSLQIIGENKVTTIVDGGAKDPGSVVVLQANNVLFSKLTVQNARSGGNAIWIDGYNYETISQCVITNNGDGIRILNSHGNLIQYNILTNNPFTALGFDWAYGNTITGNTISDNYIGVGAGLLSSQNTFINNVISYNDYGFLLAMENSKFYHNNIIGNTIQAQFYATYANTWDNGYPSGGNYWSNYVGADNYRGSTQSRLGHDEIGDTPYVIDGANQDNYPLMTPY